VRRRDFIKAAVVSLAAWPLAARAQQPSKMRVIGFLGTTSPNAMIHWTSAFEQRLSELGWIKGSSILIEYRWAEAHPARYADIAAEFVRLPVDIIVTTVPAIPALKAATSTIPIVFTLATDPLGDGLVASLARPGGNVTGLSMQATDLASKRVDLLHETLPKLSDLAVLGNVEIAQILLEMRQVETAAQKLDLEVIRMEVHRAEDLDSAFATLNGRAQALYVCTDPLTVLKRVNVIRLASAARLPTIYGIRDDGGRSNVLRRRLCRSIPTRRGRDRQNSARDKAGRHPRRTANQIRARHQSQNCQSARAHSTTNAARSRRRGDRISLSCFAAPARRLLALNRSAPASALAPLLRRERT
jgi:ABC-type uncharacterized transport system substrate-binding protein